MTTNTTPSQGHSEQKLTKTQINSLLKEWIQRVHKTKQTKTQEPQRKQAIQEQAIASSPEIPEVKKKKTQPAVSTPLPQPTQNNPEIPLPPTQNETTTKDQIGNFCIVKYPNDNLNFDEIYFEVDIPKLVELAKQGFDTTNISGVYKNPKQAQQIALRSLKEKCHAMKLERESGIQSKLNEKAKLIKLIKASKDYIKGSPNHVMVEEDKVNTYESDLTRLDLEINTLSEELAVLKQHKFEIPQKPVQ